MRCREAKLPSSALKKQKRRFEEWRNNRRGKARIPAELWLAAVEAARKEGINRTARELHVAGDDLKRRMPATGAVPQRPAFVELVTQQVQSVPECTLEVEGRRGKLRIQLKGGFSL
jgi:ribosomal protein L20